MLPADADSVVVLGACPQCGKLLSPRRSGILENYIVCHRCNDRYVVPLYKVKVEKW